MPETALVRPMTTHKVAEKFRLVDSSSGYKDNGVAPPYHHMLDVMNKVHVERPWHRKTRKKYERYKNKSKLYERCMGKSCIFA